MGKAASHVVDRARVKPGPRFAPGAALVFAVALVVRFIYLAQARGTPLTDVLLIDADTYDRFARQILAGRFGGEDVYAVNVLYPYFLALLYAVSKGSLFFTLHAQAVLDALTCAVSSWIAARHFGRAAGVLAGLLLAGSGPLVFYSGALLTPTLVTALGVLVLALLTLWQGDGRARWAVAAGLLLGLATLARGNNALFVPLALPGFLLAARARGAGARGWLAFASAALLPIALATLRNLVVAGHAVPVAANYAAFYIGHNPDANGLYVLPPWAKSGEYAQEVWGLNAALARQLGHPMTLAESARWLFDQGVHWMLAHPLEELRLAGTKFRFFFNAIEPATNLNYHYGREWSSLLRVLPFGFGVLAPLGLLGAWWGRGRERWFLMAWILVGLVTALLFYVSAEYRLPVVPVLAIFAAHALVVLFGALRDFPRAGITGPPRLLTAVVALPLLFWFCHARPAPLAAQAKVFGDYTNSGTLYARKGDLVRARALYEHAIALAPAYAPAWQGLASVLGKSGDPVGAARAAERARDLGARIAVPAPTTTGAIADSGLAAAARFQAGDIAGALVQFEGLERAARAAGDTTLATGLLNNVGLCRFRLGDTEGAARAFEQLLAERPGAVKAHYNLGRVRVAQGRPREAEAEFETALRLDPQASGVREELAALRARSR
jgi:tetratricopeptide (TPR) repeat protein